MSVLEARLLAALSDNVSESESDIGLLSAKLKVFEGVIRNLLKVFEGVIYGL